MACFDHLSPSSVLSPLLGMDMDCETNASNAGLSSLEVWPPLSDIGTAAVATSTSPPAPTSSSSSKRALSSASSLSTMKNGSVTKVSSSKPRRKSRAKPKSPVRQVSATKLNFRDIVHQFTGAPQRKAQSSQSSPDCPQIPGISENQGAIDDLQHMLSELKNASVPEKDALLAGALLAQSLRTLDCISSYILQSNMSPDSSSISQTAKRRDLLSSCGSERIDTACHERSSVAELEDYLLKGGDSNLDPYFSLSCLLLNQISSQCRVLSSRS